MLRRKIPVVKASSCDPSAARFSIGHKGDRIASRSLRVTVTRTVPLVDEQRVPRDLLVNVNGRTNDSAHRSGGPINRVQSRHAMSPEPERESADAPLPLARPRMPLLLEGLLREARGGEADPAPDFRNGIGTAAQHLEAGARQRAAIPTAMPSAGT